MTGFVLWRARAHRLLLGAALLAVLLTTAVLTTLTAFSDSIGDAGLRHTLATRDAASAALVVRADVPGGRAADAAVRKAADATFDGLPVTVRTLRRSGPYALPRSLQPPAARGGDPDLTHLAALDASRTVLTGGSRPREAAGGSVEVAVPDAAARALGLRPGSELTLDDRLGGPHVRVRVTGTYRPADIADPYWRLDELGGRGVQKGEFTTYGPLLAAPGVLTGGRVSAGGTGWVATAGFGPLTTGRIGALRAAASSGPAALLKEPSLGGATDIGTGLPDVLDRVERALSVARNTLLVVALQLVLLAAGALLLVARLLSSERAGETRLLRARGGSRRRLAALAAAEALLLALPAAVCGPLLAMPLARLLVDRGGTSGLTTGGGAVPGGPVWLTAAAVALGCAVAVAAPAFMAGTALVSRARALPAPLRAGADLGLLAIAAVAYWQLRGHTSGGDGVDPLLVAAPALALLAGTVLVLRLLPLLVRLGERRATRGGGLVGALAGWQLSRRPGRGAGPVLLLVLTVAMGMLALGQGASWHRSQDDQADFLAGADVRLTTPGGSGLGQSGAFAALPGVRDAVPATRSTMTLSDDRAASVLALDTASAGDGIRMRGDLGDKPTHDVLAPLGTPARGGSRGVPLPRDTRRLDAEFTLGGSDGGQPAEVTLTVLDRYGIPYRLPLPPLPADARPHRLALDIASVASGAGNRMAEPLTLTGVDVETPQPGGAADTQRLSMAALRALTGDGTGHPLEPGGGWRGTATAPAASGADPVEDTTGKARPTSPRIAASGPTLSASYGTGFVSEETVQSGKAPLLTLRLVADAGHIAEIPAVATDRFLDSSGAAPGRRIDVPVGSSTVRVRIVGTLRALPTTGAETTGGAARASSTAAADAGDGGALLIDLRALNRMLLQRSDTGVTPDEWWLTTGHGGAAKAAGALRARPDIDPTGVLVRDEAAASLRDDPLGAGPEAAFTATTAAAAVLAAVGFAVGAVASLRERREEFTVLRALGAPRGRLARTVAVEYATLIVLALVVGTALGALLTRAVVPLVVLTPAATVPVPTVLVELPPVRVAVLLLAVAAAPVLITAFLALRGTASAGPLRAQGGE
ncbi:FtsX-like permease family protein [Streptomyces sp. NPDC050560]|uniref:FtsX-like permease family protein n=1 Tax=Streptomyces sp. NPDC050560 TaxID=3365630 RepID=UPI00379AF78E